MSDNNEFMIQTAHNMVMCFQNPDRIRTEYEQFLYEHACRFLETHYKACRLIMQKYLDKEFPDEVRGTE